MHINTEKLSHKITTYLNCSSPRGRTSTYMEYIGTGRYRGGGGGAQHADAGRGGGERAARAQDNCCLSLEYHLELLNYGLGIKFLN